MSSLATRSDLQLFGSSEVSSVQKHFNISRAAYDMLKQESSEEIKPPCHEADDEEEGAYKVCIKLLRERSLTFTQVDGEDLRSLINALLQHAAGNYDQGSFNETDGILEGLVEEIKGPTKQSLERGVIEDALEAVNKAMNTNILVCILELNSRFKLEIVDQIGSNHGDPAVIWHIKEGRYSCIIPVEPLNAIQPDSTYDYNNNNSIASITQSYRAELQSFKLHIYDIANPLIAKEILNALKEIEIFDDPEDLLFSFGYILKSEETTKAIESLINEIKNLLLKNPNELYKYKALVIEDLKRLSADIDLEEEPWEELRVLLDIQAIRELPNIDIKKMKHYIYKEDTENLREYVESVFSIRKIDIKEIDSILSDADWFDLETHLAEIINKKPAKKEDLLSFWGMKEDFFINKTFYLDLPNLLGTINGLIEQCYRRSQDSIYFKLHNNTSLDIVRTSANYTITISTESNLPFWTAFEENKLRNVIFKIRTPQNFEEYTSNMIYPGSYRIKKQSIEKNEYFRITNIYLTETCKQTEYCISAKYYHEGGNSPAFKILNLSNKKKHANWLQFGEFRKTYIAVLEDTQRFTCDPSKHMIIRDEIDENQLKIKHLKQIYAEIDSLRVELSKEENIELVNNLLDSLARNRIQSIEIEILDNLHREDLTRKFKLISKMYKQYLNQEKPPEDILKQIVIDANYARMIKKSQVLEVSKAMELIKHAFANIDEIRGKDIILFIGNTGSGKSTTISHLLGAALEYFYNRAGDQVVRVKDESNSGNYPAIGQSLGESETLYTRGYYAKAQDKKYCPVLITDCPGFNDTRGGHYELCTNLSIDQTIKECANIKAIVIAIPIQAFQMDRSNPILNLIESVVERFEDTFDANKPESNKRVFLLITKCNQASQEVVKKLRNGQRFKELYSEAENTYSRLYESQNEDRFELEIAERKKNIWHTVLRMHDAKQVDILDIKNKRQRIELLEKYSKSENYVNKASYSGLMQSRDMQIKFGKCIEMSTHTWTHLIFKEYLEVLPSYIEASKNRIGEYYNRIHELEREKESQMRRINDLTEERLTLREQIEKHKLDSGHLNVAQDITLQIIKKIKSEIEIIKKEISETEDKIRKTSDEILGLESKILEIETEIDNIQNEVLKLSQGVLVEKLYEEDFRGREKEIIEIYQHENREAYVAVEEFKELEETGEAHTQGKANCIRGSIVRVKVFEKSYRLVPSDPDLRREFEKNFRYISGDAKYEARIEGEGYRLIKCKASGDGRKVAYHFELQFECRWYHWLLWKDPKMPWIKITHEIPYIDYNEAAIINKNAIVNQLLREQAATKAELGDIDGNKGKYIQKQKLEQKLTLLNAKLVDSEMELEQMKSTYMRQYLNKKSQEIEKEIEQLESSTEIEDEIKMNEREISIEQEKIKDIAKTKKHLAIIIKTQIDTAKLIREFTKVLMLRGEMDNMETTGETLKACKEFNFIFDSSIGRIESEVEHDLIQD